MLLSCGLFVIVALGFGLFDYGGFGLLLIEYLFELLVCLSIVFLT